MNNIRKTSLLFSAVLALFSLGCSNAPTHVILAPQVVNAPTTVFDKTVTLNIIDMRTSNHIIQILKEGKAATILSSDKRLEGLIGDTLKSTWQKQGLQFSDLANTDINITIDKAITSVTQKTMSYSTQSEIVVTVKIANTQQTLTNTFKTRGNSEGALKADIAVLERDFNTSLNTLLTKIINSKDVIRFLAT